MPIRFRLLALLGCAGVALLSVANPRTSAQTLGEPEDFTANAIVNNNLASGAGMVLIQAASPVRYRNFPDSRFQSRGI